ncbi:TetR/AcrR family transcriptional regulator [Subtercola endophyticus]|uniref:TetR/AcrR family transcriptional regulator n=1 Tax=Subtercola endophyticus TaxID=2895559 RepID=UPI001E656155|nr:TetR family transcriptional regulator C-terminal domain-containing protein [Subtercola endophyticus]UFS57558.1 TetR family transcriptional regulator C-terminal domain-containing protein [Subtercola endophyticus]
MSSTGRKRNERTAPAERIAQIEAAAMQIALSSGLTALTLRSIGAEVGVTPALVSHYQPSMESLIAQTFTAIVRREIAEVNELLAPLPSATGRLHVLIETLLDGGRSDVTVVWVDAWSLGQRSDMLAAAVREQMDAWEDLVSSVIAQGAAAGEFSGPALDDVAWHVLGMVDGLNAQSLVRYRDASARRLLLGRAIEQSVGLPSGTLA